MIKKVNKIKLFNYVTYISEKSNTKYQLIYYKKNILTMILILNVSMNHRKTSSCLN